MHNNLRFIIFMLALGIMISCGILIGDYFTPTIIDQFSTKKELEIELEISPDDYKDMITNLNTERDTLYEKINRQTDSIASIESNMAFLLKEDILNKIAAAIKDTGASFDNFYVTFEGSIKNDYSVQVKGNIYQINEFIENLFIDTPGISIGEFSIRENEDANFLLRYFDDSNALMWYDGSIYSENDNFFQQEAEEIVEENVKKIKEEFLKLPEPDKIKYVMTLTFRV